MSLKPFDKNAYQGSYARWAGLADLSTDPEQREQEVIIDFIHGAFLCGYWQQNPPHQEDIFPYDACVEELRKKVNLDGIVQAWITLYDIQIAQRYIDDAEADMLYQLGNAIYTAIHPTEAVKLPTAL